MTITIKGKPYRLSFNLSALEDVEEVFGGIQEMRDAAYGGKRVKDPSGHERGQIWSLMEILRIMINAALAEDAEEFHTRYEPVSHRFISSALSVEDLFGVRDALMGVMMEGMKSRKHAEKSEEFRDLSTEAVKKETAE